MSYSKEQFKKIYQTLPEALKEALGSVEIQDEIDTICQENGVADDALIDKVYNLAMDVFMGLVHPDKFDDELAKILKGQEEPAQEIAHRVQRFVLFPLKAEIAQLHRIEQPASQASAFENSYIIPEGEEAPEQKTEKQKKSDTYRETVE